MMRGLKIWEGRPPESWLAVSGTRDRRTVDEDLGETILLGLLLSLACGLLIVLSIWI